MLRDSMVSVNFIGKYPYLLSVCELDVKIDASCLMSAH